MFDNSNVNWCMLGRAFCVEPGFFVSNLAFCCQTRLFLNKFYNEHWTPWPENPGYHIQVWDKNMYPPTTEPPPPQRQVWSWQFIGTIFSKNVTGNFSDQITSRLCTNINYPMSLNPGEIRFKDGFHVYSWWDLLSHGGVLYCFLGC